MSASSDTYKVIAVALLIVVISVFSEITIITVLALILGGIMMLLGILNAHRPSAFLGTLVVAVGGTSSMRFTSLLDVGGILTAVAGLLLPVLLLSLHALGVESEDIKAMILRKRPAMLAILFGVLCVLSAPLATFGMSIFLPTVAMRIGTIGEISIMLVFTVAGVLFLTRHIPVRQNIEASSDIRSRSQ